MTDLNLVFENLGGFKTFQIKTFLHCCFIAYISSIPFITEPFTAYNNPHRCNVPSCDTPNSNYEESFVNFTIPYDETEKEYDQCNMYKYTNNTNITETVECSAENFDQMEISNCSSWEYDTQMFTSTLVTTFDLVCDRAFLIPLGGSSYMTGMLIGSSSIGAITDKYGRRSGLLISALIFGFCGIGSALAPNYIVFLVFRALTGAGGVGFFQVAFVIAVEMVGSKWRTFCGILINIPFALGEATTGLLAYFIRDWRWLQGACTAPGLIIIIYYWIMPESVRWLVSQNRIDEAIKIVDKAAKINKIPSPSHYLKNLDESVHFDVKSNQNIQKNEASGSSSLLALVKSPNMRKRSLILFFTWSVCTIAYYGLSSNAGNLSGDIFVNYMLSMLIEVPSYVVAYFLLDLIGRKGTLMSVLLLSGIACLVSGLLPKDLKWLIISLSLLGKFGISGAFGSIFVYTAELFPTEYRGLGLGACSTCARFGGILAPIIASLSTIYQPLPLLIFGVLSIAAGLIIVLLPETMGSDLPQTLEQSENYGTEQPFWYFSCCGTTPKTLEKEVSDIEANKEIQDPSTTTS